MLWRDESGDRPGLVRERPAGEEGAWGVDARRGEPVQEGGVEAAACVARAGRGRSGLGAGGRRQGGATWQQVTGPAGGTRQGHGAQRTQFPRMSSGDSPGSRSV